MAEKSTITNTAAKQAWDKFIKARDTLAKRGKDANANDRATFVSVTLDVLPIIRKHNADNGKKVRRSLRASGYRISDSGYTGVTASAKKSKRAARTNAKRESVSAPAENVTNESANAPSVV